MKFRITLLMGIFAIWAAVFVYGAGNATTELRLLMDGKALISDQGRAVTIKKTVYISLNFFSSTLHASTQWDRPSGTATIGLGTLLIKLKEGEKAVTWDGEKTTFSRSPLVADGEFWVPLEVLGKLGLKVKTSGKQVEIGWKHNYLLSIKSASYQGRPAVVVQTAKTIEYRDYLLTEPDRLVIDLHGVERFSHMESDWAETEMFRQIRGNQYQKDIYRIVFDLKRPIGYKVVVPEGRKDQLLVVFDALVSSVSLDKNRGIPQIGIQATAPVHFKATHINDPNRLVVDITDATLGIPGETVLEGDGIWVRQIRASQYAPHTVRVVLDLAGALPCYVMQSRHDPKRIEIRTQQEIRVVQWLTNGSDGALWIESNGELIEDLQYTKDPDRLVVRLKYAKLAPDVKEIAPAAAPVRNIRAIQESPSDVRIELDLDSFVGYQADFSSDRRIVTLRMKESPVKDRIIVLDPGHGGVDPGALGSQGVREKEVNLEVALRLKDLLEQAGARVVMTRVDDQYYSLYERAAIANRVGAALFISIHTNYHPNPNINGVEIFHYPDRTGSNRLGSLLLEETTKATGLKPLAVKTNKDLVVIRETQMPSVLVEMGFISNAQEEALIATTEFREAMARGIFQGIVRYYTETE